MPLGSAFGSSVRRAAWYGLSTWTPAAGSSHRTAAMAKTPAASSTSELPPADSDEEQHGEQRRRVDECGAEVRLEEHEEDRRRPEADHREIVFQRVARPDPPDHEPGDRKHEEHLAELGRLELDDPEVDPALRAADLLGEDEDDDHQGERRARTEHSSSGARRRSA